MIYLKCELEISSDKFDSNLTSNLIVIDRGDSENDSPLLMRCWHQENLVDKYIKQSK